MGPRGGGDPREGVKKGSKMTLFDPFLRGPPRKMRQKRGVLTGGASKRGQNDPFLRGYPLKKGLF